MGVQSCFPARVPSQGLFAISPAAMLRLFRVSGEELAAMSTEDLEDVSALKHHLRSLYGFPLCLQQLLHENATLKNGDQLCASMDVQIVLSSEPQLHEVADELLASAEQGQVEVVRSLLAANPVCDDRHPVCDDKHHGMTALMLASQKGHLEIVSLLLKARADVNLRNNAGDTALALASQEAHVEIARLLLPAGAEDLHTPLLHASARGHTQIVQLLLEAGVDKNMRNKFGNTALIRAADRGHYDVVRLLLDSGAEKDLAGNFGTTALIEASARGHTEIVRLLLEAGAAMDVRGILGSTALIRAAQNGRMEVARLLLEAGADSSLSNDMGETALSCAFGGGHISGYALAADMLPALTRLH